MYTETIDLTESAVRDDRGAEPCPPLTYTHIGWKAQNPKRISFERYWHGDAYTVRKAHACNANQRTGHPNYRTLCGQSIRVVEPSERPYGDWTYAPELSAGVVPASEAKVTCKTCQRKIGGGA